jgi:Sugar efflux transporter for intercellular exchange
MKHQIMRQGKICTALQTLNTLPFVLALANEMAWTVYALAIRDWYIIVPNALGSLISTFLFLNSFGLGIEQNRSRDIITGTYVALAGLLLAAAIIVNMVITSHIIVQQIWGYLGAKKQTTKSAGECC